MFVLDTNTVAYFFKGLGKVSDRLLATPPRDVAIPAIVLYEILVGIRKAGSPDKRTAQLQDFVSLVRVLPFGEREAEQAASIRADLEKKGRPIGPHDILIAATALSSGGVLVTHNIKEFKRIEGLRLEDWF